MEDIREHESSPTNANIREESKGGKHTHVAEIIVQEVPLYLATKKFVETQGLGTTFIASEFDNQDCPITRWPQPDWRPVEDGVGGGITEGTFQCFWDEDGSHLASNSGVADGDYKFAFASLEKAIQNERSCDRHFGSIANQSEILAPVTSPDRCFCCTEINYHACGSQLFAATSLSLSSKQEGATEIEEGVADFICLVALPPPDRAPDNVLPSDFIALFVPRGTGLSVNARVWHAPPVICGQKSAVIRTKQARVHSKIYYHPLQEHATVFSAPCKFRYRSDECI